MYYIIVAIIFIIILYCLLLRCRIEYFTHLHPCKHKCKQNATIQKYNCSMLNSDEIATCVHNAWNQGLNCEYNCQL